MSRSQFSLSWDSFKNNISHGFSAFQQNGEFVDLTIAADGHFVKVHQVIVALASPYLKKLMASAPCQHPVIFLNNVSHKVLCYLLEYMYMGEVVVPSEYLSSFTNAAKELQIKGLENINDANDSPSEILPTLNSSDNRKYIGGKRKMQSFIELDIPPTAKKVILKQESGNISVNQSYDTRNDSRDYTSDMFDDGGAQDNDDDDDFKEPVGESIDMDQVKSNPSNLLYTVSIRGSLQVILNRYMYNLNTTTARTGVRRWRCVDYRNNKCNAYVVTKGNIVVNRSHLHNHPFHDKKILSKIEKKAVFSAIDDVQAYREKEKAAEGEDKLTEDETME